MRECEKTIAGLYSEEVIVRYTINGAKLVHERVLNIARVATCEDPTEAHRVAWKEAKKLLRKEHRNKYVLLGVDVQKVKVAA